MNALLIVEGNPPELVKAGLSGAEPFKREIAACGCGMSITAAQPYLRALAARDLEGVDGVLFTGSATEWGVDAPEAAPQRAAMELALASGKPIWGSCNGMQLAVIVLGGAIGASLFGQEIPLARDVSLTKEGARHPMMAGRSEGFAVPCLHRDEVTRLPDGAVTLATNAHSAVQAIAIESGGVSLWGAQYHPELAAEDIAKAAGSRCLFENSDLQGWDHPAFDRQSRVIELSNWLETVQAGAP